MSNPQVVQSLSMSEHPLKHTPLYEEHLALKARMVPFGGWEMPLQYDGILTEYEYTRRGVAIFDTSHMGEFMVEGDAVQSGLDQIVTQSIKDMPIKSCRYGTMLNSEGGVMDDLIVFRLAERKWMIVVNGATMEKDAQHFSQYITPKTIFKNISYQTGKIDVQGPLSREILKTFIHGIEKLDYYTLDEFILLGEKVIISRTGYTGELGYEIFFPWEKTALLWRELLKNDKVRPAGLGARDVLRTEMGYSLYGHELSETISPLEAGLEKFIDFQKDFLGKEVLLKQKGQGLKRKIIGFVSENRRSPRQDYKIFSRDLKEMGVVTSGTFSPSLNRGVGLGFVDAAMNLTSGEKIYFGDEKNAVGCEITKRPFYKNGSLKN